MSRLASDAPDPSLWVIGNPENRRCDFYCAAAERLRLPRPRIVSYDDLLTARVSLAEQVPAGAMVRIESPGENMTVERGLVLRGARLAGASVMEAEAACRRASEHGCIAAPHWWFAGFCDLLREIEATLRPLHVRWLNHPAEIPRLFDKRACHAVLNQAGIPLPPALLAPDQRPTENYADLRARMRAAGWSRAFIKLQHGSSAVGVVALRLHRGQTMATTSARIAKDAGGWRLYNSLSVQTYHQESEIAAIIDELCRFGVHVEQWLPKAGFRGRTFDLRLVVIGGQVRQVVMRTSRGPITNLHLGNQRGDLAALLEEWPLAAQEAAWETCRRTAGVFPRSLYAGVDLAVLPGLRRHAILELNAFGDLLPGVLASGDDTYTSELKAVLAPAELPPPASLE